MKTVKILVNIKRYFRRYLNNSGIDLIMHLKTLVINPGTVTIIMLIYVNLC